MRRSFRLTRWLREFVAVDLDMTRRASLLVSPAARRVLCAPPLLLLWLLDALDETFIDLGF